MAAAAAILLAGILWQVAHLPEREHPALLPRAARDATRPTAPRVVAPSPAALRQDEPPAPSPPFPSPTPPGRSSKDWLAILERLVAEGYRLRHPETLAKLSGLLADHPEDPEWEAGAVLYLAWAHTAEDPVAIWKAAAEALPANPLIADSLVKSALVHWGASGARVDALLAEQLRRTPKDPHLLWLRSCLAFESSRPEAALAFLKASQGLPGWSDRTGLSERGAISILEAMEGPVGPAERFRFLCAVPMPELAHYGQATHQAGAWAISLQGRGRVEEAREALEALGRMGGGVAGGSRRLFGYLAGLGAQEKAAQSLQALAVATGDFVAQAEARSRLEAVQGHRQAFWAWSAQRGQGISEDLKLLLARYAAMGFDVGAIWKDPGRERLQGAEAFLTPSERTLLGELSERSSGDMDAFRAWEAERARNAETPR